MPQSTLPQIDQPTGDAGPPLPQTLDMLLHNAVNAQQQAAVMALAGTTQAVSTILTLDTAAVAAQSKSLLEKGGASAADVAAQEEAAAGAQAAMAKVGAAAEDIAASKDPALAAIGLDVAALAMIDAVQHLQRVEIIAEAATALALAQSIAVPDNRNWPMVLQGVQRSVVAATQHLEAVCMLGLKVAGLSSAPH